MTDEWVEGPSLQGGLLELNGRFVAFVMGLDVAAEGSTKEEATEKLEGLLQKYLDDCGFSGGVRIGKTQWKEITL